MSDDISGPFERPIQLIAGLAIFGYRMWTDDHASTNVLLDAPVNTGAFWIMVMQYSLAIVLIVGISVDEAKGLVQAWKGTKP